MLFDITAEIIKDILESSSFQYVIVITSVCSAVHLWKKTGSLDGDDKDVFFQFEEKLMEWMGSMVRLYQEFGLQFFRPWDFVKVLCISVLWL